MFLGYADTHAPGTENKQHNSDIYSITKAGLQNKPLIKSVCVSATSVLRASAPVCFYLSGRAARSHQSRPFLSYWPLNVSDSLETGNEKVEFARCVFVYSEAATRRSAESRGPEGRPEIDHESRARQEHSNTTRTHERPSLPKRKASKCRGLCTMTSHQGNLQHVR
jgi:hypothetical protein